MQIGVITPLNPDNHTFDPVVHLGLKTCQLAAWKPGRLSREAAARVIEESRSTGVRVSALWAGWSGPHVWDFKDGPETLGIVPPAYRFQRCEELKRAADFAKQIGTRAIITHAGFLPENLTDPLFPGTVSALRDVVGYCKSVGVEFWYETGQETPIALLRIIEAVGYNNQGINLDPANLILYGKANPVDALEVFGKYVRSLHIKDGTYPTQGNELGYETKVGEGRVNFDALFTKLKELGYKDDLIIEREIVGEQQTKDIKDTIEFLKPYGGVVE